MLKYLLVSCATASSLNTSVTNTRNTKNCQNNGFLAAQLQSLFVLALIHILLMGCVKFRPLKMFTMCKLICYRS